MLDRHTREDKCSVGTGHRTNTDGVTLDSLSSVVASSQSIFPRKGKSQLRLFQNDIFNWHSGCAIVMMASLM